MFPQLHTGVCVEADRELRTGGAFPTGRLHMAELRSSGEQLSAKPDRRSPLSTVLTILLVLIPAAILVWMALHLSSKTLLIGAIAQVLGTALVLRSSSVWKPATSALMTGLFLASPLIGFNTLFERKGWRYFAVNAGFWIVCLVLMGGIVCGWK